MEQFSLHNVAIGVCFNSDKGSSAHLSINDDNSLEKDTMNIPVYIQYEITIQSHGQFTNLDELVLVAHALSSCMKFPINTFPIDSLKKKDTMKIYIKFAITKGPLGQL